MTSNLLNNSLMLARTVFSSLISSPKWYDAHELAVSYDSRRYRAKGHSLKAEDNMLRCSTVRIRRSLSSQFVIICWTSSFVKGFTCRKLDSSFMKLCREIFIFIFQCQGNWCKVTRSLVKRQWAFPKKKLKKRIYYFLQKMIDIRIIPSVSENIHILLPLKWTQQVWHCLEGFLGAKIAPLQHCPPRTGPGHQCRWLTVCLVGHPEG